MLASALSLGTRLVAAWPELSTPSQPRTWRAWLTSADGSTLTVVAIAVLLVTCLGFWAGRDAVEAQQS